MEDALESQLIFKNGHKYCGHHFNILLYDHLPILVFSKLSSLIPSSYSFLFILSPLYLPFSSCSNSYVSFCILCPSLMDILDSCTSPGWSFPHLRPIFLPWDSVRLRYLLRNFNIICLSWSSLVILVVYLRLRGI